jgi:glycogen debranching enzyme
MSLTYGLRRIVSIVVAACSFILIASVAGAAPSLEPRSTTAQLDEKRYVAAGDRAYVIGSEDGRFPPMGWHIRGEMGGVWAHPIKLLDGYWFALDDQWIPQASRFTTGAGYVQMQFPTTAGLEVTRTEFAPDDSPVVLVGLTLRNPDSTSRSVKLTMDARSEVMAAYPWTWTRPSAKCFNQKDEANFDSQSQTLTFKEGSKPWFATVGSSERPARRATGDQFWGPVTPDQQPEYYEYENPEDQNRDTSCADGPRGTGGQLMWNLSVGGNQERTLWVAVGGSQSSQSIAQRAVQSALRNPDNLLAQKVQGRQALLDKTQVDLPDEEQQLQDAFDWGKLNMADLRITVKDMKVRDVDEGRAYPPPAGSISSATGIGAGFPDYPWFFGTDGAYTAYPLLVSGQWDTLKEHLRTIKRVSEIVNGNTGKVVHEVMTDGSVYWGTNNHPGNTMETAQFATAVYQLWRWSGNDKFRDEMYPFVVRGMDYITSSECPVSDPHNQGSPQGTCDDDEDGWPEGYGMVERGGMGEEKLDNTAYTWQALRALQRMAESKDDTATATWADGKADAMEAKFDAAWWMPAENLYADSLCNSPNANPDPSWTNYCTQAGQQLQQRHWINATPMEVLLAPEVRANAALDTLEMGDFTGECGLFHTGVGGGPTGAGELKCWTLPTSVMAVGEANYGRLANNQALFYMRSIADELDLEMPGALPEISPSPDYNPFVDFRERAMFMQAWSSYGVQWPVIHHFLGIRPDVPAGSLSVVPDVPDSWPGLSVKDLQVGGGTVAASASHQGNTYTTKVSESPADWNLTIGHTLPAGATVETVRLDGDLLDGDADDYDVVNTFRGREVHVQTSTGGPHTLEVTTSSTS